MKKRFFLLLSIVFLTLCRLPAMAFADSQSTTIKYSVQATVIYVEYDGVRTIQKVPSGSTLKEPAHREKAGSIFIGWKNSETGLLWNFQDPVTEHLTLVAQYEAIKQSGGSSSSGRDSSAAVSSGGGGSSDDGIVPAVIRAYVQERKIGPGIGYNSVYGNIIVALKTKAGMAEAVTESEWVNWIEWLIENGVITNEELAQTKNGAVLKILIAVEDISSTVSKASKAETEAAADGYVIGPYMDVCIYKTMTTGDIELAREKLNVSDKLSVSICVPDNMINTDETIQRRYVIFRHYNGSADTMDAEYDDGTHMLTFETGDVSADYAIAYKDFSTETVLDSGEAANEITEGKDKIHDSKTLQEEDHRQAGKTEISQDSSEEPQQYVGSCSSLSVIAIAAICILFLFKRRKKYKENK